MDCGALNAVTKSLAQAASHVDPSAAAAMHMYGDGSGMMPQMEWGHEFEHMMPQAPPMGPMSAPYHPFLQQQQHQQEGFDEHEAMFMDDAYYSQQQQEHHEGHRMQQQQRQPMMMGGPMFPPHMMMMAQPHMMGRMPMQHMHQPMFPIRGLEQQQQQQQPQRPMQARAQEAAPKAAEEVEEPVQTFTVEGEPLRSVQEKTDASEFYKLLRDLQEHKVEIDEVEGKIVEGDPASAQATAADAGGADLEALMSAWNSREPMTEEEIAEARAHNAAWGSDDDLDEDMAERYLNGGVGGPGLFDDGDFNAAAGENFEDLGDEWAREYTEMTANNEPANNTNYPFEADNVFLLHDNPMQEGNELRSGVASEAVLAFEAACQQNLSSVEAWTLLGTTQAENEKDRLAIIALNNARNLDPKNLTVLAALAVSHTNEGHHNEALQSLRAWLLAHPEYEHLGSLSVTEPSDPTTAADDYAGQFLFVSPSAHRECCALFETAIELNPNDAEVFSNLGVLRNLSHEYEEAAQHFQAALRIRPDDAKLWNRLGATLANGSRSRDAINAYHRALDLNAGYVRAQYNLGVAHSNIGEHREAAKQLLKAVIMQQRGVQSATTTDVDGSVTGRATREMWDVIRMTFNIMDRPDLVQLTWKMDVVPFLQEFDLESFNF